MKYLRFALLGLVVCIGAIVLLYVGPIVVVLALPVAIIIAIGALCSFLWKLFTERRVTRSRQLPDNDLSRNKKNEPDIDLTEYVNDATEFIKRRLSSVWSGVEEDLARLSLLIQKRSKKFRMLWMRKRIEDMIEAHRSTFDFLTQKMNDPELNAFRVKYTDCCSEINEIEKEIADIKNAIAMNSEKPGGPNHRLLAKSEESLKMAEATRQARIESSRQILVAYGVDLNSSQVEVLLSRVDAGDIVRMTTVFSIISKMTQKLAKSKGETGENLEVTKKYYGMYIALLELQFYIQGQYLDRLNKQYIPGVQSIANEASDLNKVTQEKAKQAEGQVRQIYEKNLKSQKFTLEVTAIYKNALMDDAQKIQKARELIRKHHEVAENTLRTVQVSASLSALLTQSESLYRDLMELQMPDLVPFENLQMQREFEAVTIRLRGGV